MATKKCAVEGCLNGKDGTNRFCRPHHEFDPKLEAVHLRLMAEAQAEHRAALPHSLGSESQGFNPADPDEAPRWPCMQCGAILPDVRDQRIGSKIECVNPDCGPPPWSRRLGR